MKLTVRTLYPPFLDKFGGELSSERWNSSADTDKTYLNQPPARRTPIDTSSSLDIDTQRIDHLLLVKAFAEDLGLVEKINCLVPKQMEVKPDLMGGPLLWTNSRGAPLSNVWQVFAILCKLMVSVRRRASSVMAWKLA